jgi:hypothetical protein
MRHAAVEAWDRSKKAAEEAKKRAGPIVKAAADFTFRNLVKALEIVANTAADAHDALIAKTRTGAKSPVTSTPEPTAEDATDPNPVHFEARPEEPFGMPVSGPEPRKPALHSTNRTSILRERHKTKGTIENQRKMFRHLLPNLTFTDFALERFLSLDDRQVILASEQLKQLDCGNTRDKLDVPNTRPKLFQRDAGSDVRIYYRQDGSPNRVLVHLIGTKKTEDSDYARMQT